jgi:hypothetical protein
MATVILNVNASRTHLEVRRTGGWPDTLALPVNGLALSLDPYQNNPDLLRIEDQAETVVEFLTADSNLAGATTAARFASLLALLTAPMPSIVSTPTEWFDPARPTDPPYKFLVRERFSTTSGTDTFTVDINTPMQTELGATRTVYYTLRATVQAYPVTGGAAPYDAETYEAGFYAGAGDIVSIAPVRTSRVTTTPVSYVDDLGYTTAANALQLNVVNGDAPTETVFDVVVEVHSSLV